MGLEKTINCSFQKVVCLTKFNRFLCVFICSGLSVRGIPLAERSLQVNARSATSHSMFEVQSSTFDVRVCLAVPFCDYQKEA